ncbi:MAG: cytochrome c oxidase assembly protein [Chloroflexi bacterium]|nr:cytochrome c oxidase assembly protein [Chloroflexota bacterium]MCY3936909.1 cytochrome c oxidase assembly protein [Chloroflexota bacterium]
MTATLLLGAGSIWYHADHIDPGSGFTAWNLDPILLGAVILGVGLYLYVIGPYRERRRLGAPLSGYRIIAFTSGVFVIFLALASPIDSIGEHYLFSIHMVQHLVLMFVAAPLVVMGTPPWAIRLFPYSSAIHSVTRFLTLPMVAFLASSGVFLIWHVPLFYESALEIKLIHDFEHLTILGVGMLMWWPALSPVRALPSLSAPAQLLYFFVLPIPTSIVGALITFMDEPLYSAYVEAPRLWGLSALVDQEMAGLLMWVPGKLVFWAAMAVAFFRWFSDADAPDSPRLRRNL